MYVNWRQMHDSRGSDQRPHLSRLPEGLGQVRRMPPLECVIRTGVVPVEAVMESRDFLPARRIYFPTRHTA